MERVRASLAEHGLNHLTVREFAASTATASDAAAAIGTPNAVFAIAPPDLVRITDGRVEDVI